MLEKTISRPMTYHPMSVADFAHFGENRFAYLKPVVVNGENLVGVFAADGQELALFEERDLADATVRYNDLVPLSVH